MKTQIVHRIILITVIMLIYIDLNGEKKMLLNGNSVKVAATAQEKQVSKTATENPLTDAPFPFPLAHDNDFDCFDFKHHEVRSFWRCIANKVFAVLYHIIILGPFLIEILKQFLLQGDKL